MRNETMSLKKQSKEIDLSKPLIELKNITKTYKTKKALNNINLTIMPGDRIGVIGANGGGKSTLSEIIGGIRKPTSGQVIRQENLKIGLQFQESRYPIGITVFDMIKYYLEAFNVPMSEEELTKLLKRYQINPFRNKFLERLSGGQQQRVNILLSMIHNPDLVILDEISTGLDIEVRGEIFEFIRENVIEKNKAMFLVTHIMTEIEDLCEKYIYISDGEIKDAGLVSDIIKEHGSIYNYTWKRFKDDKAAKNINEEIEENLLKKKNKIDKIVNTSRKKGKHIPLINLLLKYYFKGFAVPFFVLAFPIILLFLEGFAFKGVKFNPNTNDYDLLHTLVGSLAVLQIISVGIFIIPQTIIEFKNSVLLKRIGATTIKPVSFVLSVVIMGFIFMIIGFLWTQLWAGIFFGSTYTWELVAMPKQFLEMIPFFVIILVSSVTLGTMLSSVFNSTTTYIAISNVIYVPIAFLSGSIMPIDLIMNSDILKYATYLNVFKYCIDPFNAAWNGTFDLETKFCIFLGISIVLAVGYATITSLRLKWEN